MFIEDYFIKLPNKNRVTNLLIPNKMNKNTFGLILLFTFFSILNSTSQIPAFPGAEGYGKYAIGGRGGEVIRVTNLNDSGEGSLRAAIDASGPRTVIFDVGGRINLLSTLNINNPYITIAGQHSVGDGITLSMEGTPNTVVLSVNTNHVIIRYITMRRSEFEVSEQNSDNLVIANAHDVVIDHCSFSWASDENIAIYDYDGNNEANVYDITIQNCLIDTAWGGQDKGIIASGGVDRLTFYNLLFTSVGQRQPLIKNELGNYVTADTHFEIINTVTFEGKKHASFPNNIQEAGIKHLNYINNLCIDSSFSRNMLYVSTAYPVSIYTSGNISPLRTSISTPIDWDEEWSVIQPGGGSSDVQNTLNTAYRVTSPINTPIVNDGVVLTDAADLFDNLKDHVGASLPTRDSEDTRAINDVETFNDTAPVVDGTYPILNSGTPLEDLDNDGMPDFWELLEYGSLDSDGVVDTDVDGYTDLEEYLNQTANGQIPDTPAESVIVTPETAVLNLPETISLSTEFTPSNTSNQSGVWTSSDSSIATVASNGLVNSISEGVAIITFTSNDGGFTDTVEITVINIVIPLASVSLSPTDVTLEVTETSELTVTLVPANTTDSLGAWTSSDDSIATVDENGLVTAISVGQANISYTSNNAGLIASSSIIVIDTFFGTYEFYNASTDIMLQNITGDADINLEEEGNEINFRSIPQGGDLDPNVESVKVDWTGPSSGTWVESGPIYAGLPNGHVGLNFEPYVVEAGTYNFTVTYYSANGALGSIVAIDTFSLNFLFNTVPVANAGPDQDICEGETTTLTASGGPNFLWNNGETTATIEVSPLVTSTYTVSVSDNNGNEDVDSVKITVNVTPTADAGEDQSICDGDLITLIAVGGTSYLWSTGETTSSIDVNPSADTTYEVEVISNNCSSTDSVTVFVSDAPNITVSGDVVIVGGESTTLVAGGSDNYLWSTGETTTFINVTPTVTTTYTVSSLAADACSSSVDVTVTVIPEVTAEAGDDVEICNGESITLNASGGLTYVWNTGDTTSELIVNPIITTTYTVTVEDGYGYTATDTVTVVVNATPDITVSDDVIIMAGESATLSAVGGDNYLWITGETAASIIVNPGVTTAYTVTSFGAGGCNDTAQVLVTVIPELVANAGDDITICTGESATLNASGGISYTWNTGETGATTTVSPSATTIYTVTVTDVFGNSDSDSVIVTVNETPDISVSNDIEIMAGDSTTLTANGGDNYEWSTGETTAAIVVSPNTTTTYTVTSIGVSGCNNDTEQVTVTVIPDLTADAGADITICSGESTTLSASGGVSYLWNTGHNGSNLTVNPIVTTTYTVTVSDVFGNTDTDSVTVTVNETPNLTLTDDIIITDGESTILNVSGATTYQWNTGEISNSITVSPTETTTYTVMGTSNTCSAQAQVTVTVEAVFEASAGEDESVCENDNYEVVLIASQGDSYSWNTGATTQSIVVSPVSTSTYTVTVTSGGQEDSDDVTVYVDPNPNVVILNGDNVDIMDGDFVTLSVTGANSYEWNNGATQPNIAVSPSVTTTYEVRGYIGNCYDEKQVTVNVIPDVVADAGDDVVICLGEVATLTASGGDEYVWSTGETTQTIQVSPGVSTEYTVTVFNSQDFDEDSVIVIVDTDCEEDEEEEEAEEDPIEPIGEVLDFSFDVFPNPARDIVNIKLTGSDILTYVHLFDITGKLIHTARVSNDNLSISSTTQIDVSNLQIGLYYIKLIDVTREITKKLILHN